VSGTITNQVASPTKFAEYLSNGLRVITNEGLGDFSELVRKEDLGIALRDGERLPLMAPVNGSEHERLTRFAKEHFMKERFRRTVSNAPVLMVKDGRAYRRRANREGPPGSGPGLRASSLHVMQLLSHAKHRSSCGRYGEYGPFGPRREEGPVILSGGIVASCPTSKVRTISSMCAFTWSTVSRRRLFSRWRKS
jgi:hypothetical protein